ncbi:MAG: methylated-DNA--[protein]-cysteine S-methyltransferase [Clostridia bacterium]|nr:methylated-DNA--[protein]-cysteine S-methyltransferase [Clostridia bacterium]
MKNVWYYDFPIGRTAIACDDTGITDVTVSTVEAREKETELIQEAAKQLKEYFCGQRREFDVPLSISGTDFQKSVWNALMRIPYGETRSYKYIAADVGNPKASRAVGMANNRNKIIIIIPCHRVIGADGSLVGYGGGLDIKKRLLDIEKGLL